MNPNLPDGSVELELDNGQSLNRSPEGERLLGQKNC